MFKTSETTPGSASDGINVHEEADEAVQETQEFRPMGRDRAKAKIKAVGSSSSIVDLVADKYDLNVALCQDELGTLPEKLKTQIEKYFKDTDEEALPDVLESIFRRKILRRYMSDETDEENDNIYDAKNITLKNVSRYSRTCSCGKTFYQAASTVDTSGHVHVGKPLLGDEIEWKSTLIMMRHQLEYQDYRHGCTSTIEPPFVLGRIEGGWHWQYHVMIGRVWDVNATTGRYLSMDFVVSDSKNFAVRPNKDEFWVFRHDMFMLEFDGSTTIRKVSVNSVGFVRYTFELVDFDDIELTNNKYIIDVSGYVTNVRRTTYTKSGSKILDFYLANQREETAHVGMYAIVLTSMSAKTYNNKLYLSSTSSTVIYDNDDIPSLLVEPNKEVMVVDYSQPREGTVENLLLKSVSRQAGKFLCETCNRTVDYPVLRLEVVVADDTAHTIVVMFNEIATELLNCSADSLIEAEDEVGFCYLFQPHSYIDTNLHIQSAEDDSGLPTAIRNLICTTYVMELKSHTYYEYGTYESFTCWKINLVDLVDDGASSSNQLITVDDPDPSFKRLARQPSVCTPSKPNEEKRNKRSEVEDSDTDEVLYSANEPHEINVDGPMDKKKRKIYIVSGLWSEKMPKFHQLTFTIKDEEDARRAYSRK
ncbi:replication protein A 70 kDa DNA-binding subunit C-like protein [Tanacetum coccineum]